MGDSVLRLILRVLPVLALLTFGVWCVAGWWAEWQSPLAEMAAAGYLLAAAVVSLVWRAVREW